MTQKKIRLQEVADHSGVSFITAWRALNAPDKVSAKTRAQVVAASEQLGYVPNMAARSLVSSKSGIVGVVVPTLYDSIFADTVQGIADVLRPTGVELMIGLSDYDGRHEVDIVKAFLGRQIDGLILAGRSHHDTTQKLLRNSGLPIVEIWDYGDEAIDMQAGFSSHAMAYAVTDFLVDRGYRRIAFASPPGRSRAEVRQRGYLDALQARDLPTADNLVIEISADLQGGAAALDSLMNLSDPADAIFFNGDTMAIGAHLAGSAKGLTFPSDVALIGVHDLDIASRLHPPLSTVRIPRYEIGTRAAALLQARLDGEQPTKIAIDVGFEIIKRNTT